MSYNIIIFVPNAGTLPSNGICKFNFLAVVVSEISGGPKFTLGGPSSPGRHLAEKICTRSEYFTTCNCVVNFNFLAPVVSEIIGGPKFTLRDPGPPGSSYWKNFDTALSTCLYLYNRKVSTS